MEVANYTQLQTQDNATITALHISAPFLHGNFRHIHNLPQYGAPPLFSIVVGYTNDALPPAAWRSVCSQFLKVGSDGADMKLGDLVPNCTAANGWTCNSDTIKVINTDAGVEFQARYWVWAKLTPAVKKNTFGNDEANFTPGWYKLNGTSMDWTALANDWPLPYGTAILIKSGSTSATLMSNGEVVQSTTGKIVLELPPAQWRFVGNGTPKNLTLGDFVPNCTAANGWTCNSDTIKVLNSDAGVEYQARYWVWAKLTPAVKKNTFGNDEANFTPGWYKLNGTSMDWTALANSEPINAGSGFLAKSGSTAAVIELPTAL